MDRHARQTRSLPVVGAQTTGAKGGQHGEDGDCQAGAEAARAQAGRALGARPIPWNELRTRDLERAKRFYRDTIGWTFEAAQTPDGEPYWLAMSGGVPVAGMFTLTSPEFDGVPESWIAFLAVDDVDKRVALAMEAGAKLVMPIFDVPNVGRIAMLMEPSGAGIGWITPCR